VARPAASLQTRTKCEHIGTPRKLLASAPTAAAEKRNPAAHNVANARKSVPAENAWRGESARNHVHAESPP
jgi:hypothetical protein